MYNMKWNFSLQFQSIKRESEYNMKELSQNKWVRAAIPALLLHCSIGTVYCWSIFSQEIADYIGFSKGATEWAFSFAIFFLGMSAAFLGNIVEKDIHKSSLIAAICFAAGMAGTGLFIWYGGAHPGSIVSLLGIYVCYGFIMGIGLGTGYLSPVKTLMLWFEDRKGLATGLAIALALPRQSQVPSCRRSSTPLAKAESTKCS